MAKPPWVRFAPSGAQMMWGTNGLRPCSTAYGHHSNVHMNEVGSPFPEHAQTESGCTIAPCPYRSKDRTK